MTRSVRSMPSPAWTPVGSAAAIRSVWGAALAVVEGSVSLDMLFPLIAQCRNDAALSCEMAWRARTSVKVGLGALREGDPVLGEGAEEGRGHAELFPGELVPVVPDGLGRGDRAKPAERVPGGVALQDLAVLRVGDLLKPDGQPLLEEEQEPVDVRKVVSWVATWCRRALRAWFMRAIAHAQVPLTHEGIGSLSPWRSVIYVRDLLVASGILPPMLASGAIISDLMRGPSEATGQPPGRRDSRVVKVGARRGRRRARRPADLHGHPPGRVDNPNGAIARDAIRHGRYLGVRRVR
jgi:hypothetical protein